MRVTASKSTNDQQLVGELSATATTGFPAMQLLRSLLSAITLPALAIGQGGATSTIHTDTMVIRGRFVDGDGIPIQRCTVQLTGHQSTGYDLAWAAADWANPPEITTTASGEFRFTFPLPAANEARDRNRYHIQASHAKHAPWFSHCTFEVATALGGIDYGDIQLPAGVRPRIRCVDTNGALQSGVTLWLKPQKPVDAFIVTPEFGPHSWITQGVYDTTDIDGTLHLKDPAVAAECSITATNRALHQAPASVTLAAKDPIVVVVSAVPADAVIEGRIVDARGEPVAGATLSARGEGGASCQSRRDGRFTLLRDEKTKGGTATIRMAKNRRYDQWVPVATIDWGIRDAKIVVPAATAVTFEVRIASGAPVEDFNLYCLPVAQGSTEIGTRQAGSFAGGRVICKLAPGAYRVFVHPRTDAALPSEWTVIDVGDQDAVQRIVVEASRRRSVRLVIHGQGNGAEPAAGALVEVIAGRAPQPFEFVMPATAAVDGGKRRESQLVAASRSDAEGNAVVNLPDLADAVHLRVSGPTIQTHIVPVDLPWRDEPLVVEVVPGASISGTVGPLADVLNLDPDYDPKARRNIYDHQRRYGATITAVSGSYRREGILLDHQGRFTMQGLPPGPVELALSLWRRVGDSRQRIPDPLPLGTLAADPAKPLVVDLKLPKR